MYQISASVVQDSVGKVMATTMLVKEIIEDLKTTNIGYLQ
jgi:hypothetical protein